MHQRNSKPSNPQKNIHLKIGSYECSIPPGAFRWMLTLLALLLVSIVVLIFILCTTPSGRSFLLQLVQAMKSTASVPI